MTRDNLFIVSTSDDMTVKVWDVSTGRCLRTFEGHEGAVISHDISYDSRYIVSASADFLVKLWEMTTVGFLGFLTDFKGHTDVVSSVSISYDC
ncbi:wd40 repeat, subgroup, partial [Candidatus Magnetoovum chiemensis]